MSDVPPADVPADAPVEPPADVAEAMTGAMIAFVPRDPELIAVAGGDAPDDLHVTCLYLADDASTLDQTTIEQLAAVCQRVSDMGPPVEALVAAVAQFRPGSDGAAATALILEADDLVYAHQLLDDAVGEVYDLEADQYPVWIPHVTVGYSPAGSPLDVPTDIYGQAVVLDKIGLYIGGDRTEFLLSGETIEDPNALPDAAEPAPAATPEAAAPAAAATVPRPSFRLIVNDDELEASDTPGMAITRHPAAGFYAGPAPSNAVKES